MTKASFGGGMLGRQVLAFSVGKASGETCKGSMEVIDLDLYRPLG